MMKCLHRMLFTVTLSVFLLFLPAAAEDCVHEWITDIDWDTATAYCTCTNPDCEETTIVDCAIESRTIGEPGCDNPESIEYTAVYHIDGTEYSTSKIITGTALGHNYSTPAFQWSADNTTATASAYCSRCDQTVTLDCTISTDGTPATCESAGCTVYTASITLSGTSYQEQQTVILPQLDHRYSVPEFHWTENGECYAHYTCLVGDEPESAACTVTEQKQWNNCTDPGVLIRTATITLNGVPYAARTESPLPAKQHTTERILGFAATCTEDGLTDGLRCSDCGEVLLDQTVISAEGHDEILIPGTAPTCTEDGYTDCIVCGVCQAELQAQTPLPAAHTLETQAAVSPTCTQPGSPELQYCSVCGEQFTEAEPMPALGHLYGKAQFIWDSNATNVIAYKHCQRACGIDLFGTVTLTSSTYTENGVTTTTICANVVFPDETTARQTKVFQSGTPTNPTAPTVPNFDDVIRGSYYASAVAWATKEGITQGTGGGKFSPDMNCSRAQIVTMLWRAAGSPKVSRTASFEDVAKNAYYDHAVAWAFEKGITAGTSATTFSPDMPCSRAQIVTMLWRAAGCPKSENPLPFADVANDSWYADAVAWAVENGITQGTGGGCFSPDDVCTRAQIVTFLYRAEMNN